MTWSAAVAVAIMLKRQAGYKLWSVHREYGRWTAFPHPRPRYLTVTKN
jgi:hypothetical protein